MIIPSIRHLLLTLVELFLYYLLQNFSTYTLDSRVLGFRPSIALSIYPHQEAHAHDAFYYFAIHAQGLRGVQKTEVVLNFDFKTSIFLRCIHKVTKDSLIYTDLT